MNELFRAVGDVIKGTDRNAIETCKVRRLRACRNNTDPPVLRSSLGNGLPCRKNHPPVPAERRTAEYPPRKPRHFPAASGHHLRQLGPDDIMGKARIQKVFHEKDCSPGKRRYPDGKRHIQIIHTYNVLAVANMGLFRKKSNRRTIKVENSGKHTLRES